MNDKLILEELISRYELNCEVSDRLARLFPDLCASPVHEAIWGTFNELSDMVAEKLSDHDGWIGWFIWENDCGAKGLSAKVNGVTKNIRTINELLWAINEGNKI